LYREILIHITTPALGTYTSNPVHQMAECQRGSWFTLPWHFQQEQEFFEDTKGVIKAKQYIEI
jgi:hypothetical protein